MPVPIRPLVRQLLATNALVRQTVVARLRRNGLSQSLPQLQVMAILAEGPRNLSELAERQGVTLACMSATVSRLVDRALVKRRRSAEDRRQVILELLPRGITVL
ncbi:MAG: MarR family transcriptional regulator, partial [Anaerolineales bacterium]|nr:MarR family transcriptional regulator [Anaerolineales bacterium]